MKNLEFKSLSEEQIKSLKLNNIVYYMNEKVKIVSKSIDFVTIRTLRNYKENVVLEVPISQLEIVSKIIFRTIDLDFKFYPEKRRCGNTTRIADASIQALFDGYRIIVIDHKRKYNFKLYRKIKQRLKTEFAFQEFDYDEDNFEIELI
jgi:hypothetical protein